MSNLCTPLLFFPNSMDLGLTRGQEKGIICPAGWRVSPGLQECPPAGAELKLELV